MDSELPIQPQASTLAADTTPASQPVPASESELGCDSRLAAILEKKSRGEKLSAADRGYLGSVKRRGTPRPVAPAADANPLLAVPANPENPLFESAPEAQAPADSSVATSVDSGLLRSTADALLNTLDTVTKIYVGYEAKQAGGDAQTVEQYKSAVALQPENRKLMVENGEPVVLGLCKIFKCSPDKLQTVLQSSGFIGGLAMHALAVGTAVKSIKDSQRERAASNPSK